MKIIKEFREFAVKGNMIDMAIGIIIGMAFNKIINSLTNDIIFPFFSYLGGDVNFGNLMLVLQPSILDAEGNVVQELIAITYGNFFQMVFDFLVITGTIFLVIKLFNRFRRKAEDENNPTVATPRDIELLSEIRDILKEKNNP